MKRTAKNNKTTLYISLAVIAIVLFFIFKKKKNKDEAKENNNSQNYNDNTGNAGNTNTTSAKPTCDETKVLKQKMNSNSWKTTDGAQCNQIKWVQKKLNVVNGKGEIKLVAPLATDGVFGPKTEAAVQKAFGKKAVTWKEVRTKYPAETHPI